jgi:histo-blood group ABO system transferase
MLKKVGLFIFLLLSVNSSAFTQTENNKRKVGLCIVATGKYDQFVAPLVESARKYFCCDDNVTFFVFTDGVIPEAQDIVRIEQKRLGWPYDTMMRFGIYASHADIFSEMDYLFATDADMLFVGKVGREIFSELVATQHPGFVTSRGTYETNFESRAYVAPHEGSIYCAGGFLGGRKNAFLQACAEINKRIEEDLKNNIVAVWHDESHWNRYLIDHPPTKVLTPSYCYPERWDMPYIKRLLALDKNHSEFRN